MRDHASKLKGLVWLALACACGIFFAAGLSPLAHMVPWSWEKRLAQALPVTLPEKECRFNAQADLLLQRVVKRLYPLGQEDADFSIEVNVAQNPIVNAYAGLGGTITLNSGLLNKAESPEEVAGVLAHEIEHVHHRHILEGAIAHFFTAEGIQFIFGTGSSAGGFARYLLNMDFTKGQERQADEDGLKRLQAAHVDNRGFKDFFQRMERETGASSFLSDHPSNRARIEMVEKFKNENTQPLMTAEEWAQLKNYCGGK